jgi:uncharacterized protein
MTLALRLRRAVLPLTLTLLTAGSALAETREERLAVAEEYTAQMVADMDMAAMIATMWKPIVDQQESLGNPVNDGQKERLQTLYLDLMTEPMRQIMLDQAPVMADLMTLEEITALRDFYATPVGKSVMLKLPRLVEAQQPQIMAVISDVLIPNMGAIEEILMTP